MIYNSLKEGKDRSIVGYACGILATKRGETQFVDCSLQLSRFNINSIINQNALLLGLAS